MSKIKKIDISIDNLKVDPMTNFKRRLEKSYDFTRTFLWLGINFINKERTSTSTKDLSNDLFQNYTYSYNLLMAFVDFKILKKISISSSKKRVVFVCINKDIFNGEFIELAKKIVEERNQ